MKRFIDHHLRLWAQDKHKKPLLLRGARQVGKTFAARQLGSQYQNFVEINFEEKPQVREIFQKDLDPHRILRDLKALFDISIDPATTLLFLDEIQVEPKALLALRYFYEKMPELSVIAAGSLLDFAVHQVGMPVGRVMSLYVYPLSFIEFLSALGHEVSIEVIMEQSPTQELSPVIHAKLLDLVAQYLAIGGMPEAVKSWREFNDPRRCSLVHAALLDAYRQDFEKYAKKAQLPYLHILFDRIPHQFGKKFNYSKIGQELRKRELAPCLDLLITAGVIHKTMYSAGQGIPIGAQADPEVFKVIFVDVALSQKILGLGFTDWLLNPLEQFVNKGDVVEAFVGQELLAYADPLFRPHLYYWRREERASEAEVDYLTQLQEHVIPIEVKSGAGSTLKSMHMFLESHTGSPYGLRFSTQNYSGYEKIHSYPLYAVAQALGANVTL